MDLRDNMKLSNNVPDCAGVGGLRLLRAMRLIFLIMVAASACAVRAAGDTPATAPAGQCLVVLVGGQPGNAMYARHYHERLHRFYAYFTRQAHVPPANITVLTGDPNFKDDLMVAAPATAEKTTATLLALVDKAKPEDQLILVILGHGAVLEDSRTLMLPGGHLQMSALGEVLNRIPARNQVVLNFASNSGDAIADLAHPGRAIVAASSAGQVNDSDYAEFFLQVLEAGVPNGGAREAQVSLLKVYNSAALHTAEWTVRQVLSTDPDQPGWKVEGKQSTAIFKKLYSGVGVSPERQFVESPESEQADAPIEIVNKQDAAAAGRRMVTETPALEDLGTAKPATCLSVKGYEPLPGSAPAEQGFLARRIVLGQPQLLPIAPAKDH